MDFGELILQIVILLMALTVHETAHAWSANRLGDPTAKMLGRINLNPIAHVDPFGTLLFPGFLIISNLVAGANLPVFGWAKPVPVNTLNLRHPRRDHAWISAAGPLSNIGLAAVSIVLFRLLVITQLSGKFVQGALLFFFWSTVINLVLAAFNLIPVPPLDGGGILSGVLPDNALPLLDAIRPYGILILLVLLVTPILDGYIGLVFRLSLTLLGLS